MCTSGCEVEWRVRGAEPPPLNCWWVHCWVTRRDRAPSSAVSTGRRVEALLLVDWLQRFLPFLRGKPSLALWDSSASQLRITAAVRRACGTPADVRRCETGVRRPCGRQML